MLKKFFVERQDIVVQLYLGFVFLVFIGILIMAYVIAKRANPILLDQQGKPINSQVNR